MYHIIQQGECLATIARHFGFGDWQTIYLHPENADFRIRRPDPNVVFPDDRLFIPELAKVLPAARDATVERFVVVKEQRATFRSLPGIAKNRPPTMTSLPNLFLAGDWTDTGWPSTMESAVRSGNAAAIAIEKALFGIRA